LHRKEPTASRHFTFCILHFALDRGPFAATGKPALSPPDGRITLGDGEYPPPNAKY
jgi:hypothetical protein